VVEELEVRSTLEEVLIFVRLRELLYAVGGLLRGSMVLQTVSFRALRLI
jgi:hypothetical protein